MLRHQIRGIVSLSVIAALSSATAVRADFFKIPNGNPTGAASATGAQGTSTLGPNPAIGMLAGTCPWLAPALKAEGFWANGADGVAGNADDWNIQYVNLSATASITLTQYNAWYGTQPASPTYTCGDLNAFGTRGQANSGGATMCLTYTRGGGTDPLPANAHWVQVLRQTPADASSTAYGNCAIEAGYCYTMDNINYGAGNDQPPPAGGLPFYDSTFYSSGSSFSDRPFHPILAGTDWQFQTFLSTASDPSPTGRTLTVYDGVWWGFSTPEPGSLGLLAMGAVFCARRRRAA